MTSIAQTVGISHLGGSQVGITWDKPYDPSLPTLVMVNSYTTSAQLYRPQFADQALASRVNLLAIEPYGHGRTRAAFGQFTYWDSAIANLQVLQALGIERAFALGTSQGGWIVARMAMLEPSRIQGIIPLGTSMDYESQESRDRGCWNGLEFCTPTIEEYASTTVGDDWVVPDEFAKAVLAVGLGEVSDSETDFWIRTYRENYRGDEGRRLLLGCTINLRDRDGLSARLDAVKCPVLWMHGTADEVYSVPNAEHGIGLFTGSASAELRVVEGGQHFLSASHPDVVDQAVTSFIAQWS